MSASRKRDFTVPSGNDNRSAISECGRSSKNDNRTTCCWSADNDAIAAAIRDQFDAVFVPKLVKLVDAIPRTDRGKIDRARLSALLGEAGSTTHHIACERVAPGHYAAEIPPNLVFFHGHFDAIAILPGAVIVERVLWPIVQAEWPDIARLRGIRRLRFRRPVFPGQLLSVSVKRDTGKVLAVVVAGASEVASAQLLVE